MTLIFEEIEQLENSLSKLKQDYTIAVIGELLDKVNTSFEGLTKAEQEAIQSNEKLSGKIESLIKDVIDQNRNLVKLLSLLPSNRDNSDILQTIVSQYQMLIQLMSNSPNYSKELNDISNAINTPRTFEIDFIRSGGLITKVERKSDVSNNAHSMKPEAHPIAFGVGG